jgi:hypothetical protein
VDSFRTRTGILMGKKQAKRAHLVTKGFSEITESSGMSGNLNEAESLTFGERAPKRSDKKIMWRPGWGRELYFRDSRSSRREFRRKVAAGPIRKKQEVIEGHDEIK